MRIQPSLLDATNRRTRAASKGKKKTTHGTNEGHGEVAEIRSIKIDTGPPRLGLSAAGQTRKTRRDILESSRGAFRRGLKHNPGYNRVNRVLGPDSDEMRNVRGKGVFANKTRPQQGMTRHEVGGCERQETTPTIRGKPNQAT